MTGVTGVTDTMVARLRWRRPEVICRVPIFSGKHPIANRSIWSSGSAYHSMGLTGLQTFLRVFGFHMDRESDPTDTGTAMVLVTYTYLSRYTSHKNGARPKAPQNCKPFSGCLGSPHGQEK